MCSIKKLKRQLNVLNKIFWFGFYSKSWINYINRKKIDAVSTSLKDEVKPLLDKYKNVPIPDSQIGNRVWVFWYTGLDSAPSIVKKCIAEMRKMRDVDLVFLDKDNLDKYFIWDENIRKNFFDGVISVTLLTDVIRNQLMSLYGGFWFDSTILVIDNNFILDHEHEQFYSVKHKDYAACTHFNSGKWSSFLSGMPKGHPLASFTYDFFVWYFSKYDI